MLIVFELTANCRSDSNERGTISGKVKSIAE
jgi:hypothetical protein